MENSSKGNFKSCSPQKTSILQCVPPQIVAHILSYIISSTRDIAKIRSLSKEINRSILPFIFSSAYTAGRPIICRYKSRNRKDFFKELVSSYRHISLFGVKWDSSGYQCANERSRAFERIFEGCDITSVLFMSQNYENKTIIPSHRAVDEHYHARLCDKMENATTLKELSRLKQEADKSGTFLPVLSELYEIKIGSSRRMICVLLNISVPHGTKALVRLDKMKNILYLKTQGLSLDYDYVSDHHFLDSDNHFLDSDFHFLGDGSLTFLERKKKIITCTFSGFIIESKQNSYTVRLPMYVTIDPNQLKLLPRNKKKMNNFYTELYDCYQTKKCVNVGVAIVDGIVPDSLQKILMEKIDQLASLQIADYHPYSNNSVRHLLHPALYPFIKNSSPVVKADKAQACNFVGESGATTENSKNHSDSFTISNTGTEIVGEYDAATEDSNNDSHSSIIARPGTQRQPCFDNLGQKYTYQYLPTYFDVNIDGKCSICDYINNLSPRGKYPDLYSSLERLFSQILPFLESVYRCVTFVKPYLEYAMIHARRTWDKTAVRNIMMRQHCSLRGQRLQVITKIVDYELGRGQSYDGVWHLEGTSHEDIVVTALYVLHQDEEITGGDILFKRPFIRDEVSFLYRYMGRSLQFQNILEDVVVPLGTVETIPKRLVVFPNCYDHKKTTVKNIFDSNRREDESSKAENKAKRRVIIFCLVNPEKRIISTQEVPPQQVEAGGTMTYEEAVEHRLKLMAERKIVSKQKKMRI